MVYFSIAKKKPQWLLQPPILPDIEIFTEEDWAQKYRASVMASGLKTSDGTSRLKDRMRMNSSKSCIQNSQICSLSMHSDLLWKTVARSVIVPYWYEERDCEVCFTQPLTESCRHQSSYWITATEKSPLSLQSCIFPSFFQCHGLLCYVSVREGMEGWMQHMAAGAHSVSWIWDGGRRQEARWTDLGLFIPVALKPTVHEMEDIMWYSWKGTACADSVFSRACIDV